MDEVFDSALEETAQRLLPLAVPDILSRDEGDTSQRIVTLREHDEYFTYVVRDARGDVLLRSHRADDSVFPAFSRMGFVDTPTHRVYFDAALQGTITIAVAEPLAHRRDVANEALWNLAWPLALLIPASLLLVWGVVRVSMAPIRSLRTGIESRGSGDLTPIPAAGLPSELGPIADAVNHLLLRLAGALDAERSFTANSAHELRTPVAAALAQTQRLIAETKDAGSRERAQQIEMALQRLSRLSEKLMQLARAEGGRLKGRETTDIAGVAKMVVDEMVRKPGMIERIALDAPEAPVMAGIDADSFAIVLRNLVENGLKHGAADAPVAIVLSGDGVLTVSNEGPPVPPDLLSRLLQPFERGTTAADGSGLGLAIVNAIAAGTGGQLALTSPLPGRPTGLEARFTAPRPGPKDRRGSEANRMGDAEGAR